MTIKNLNYQKLMAYEYRFTLGRKGKLVDDIPKTPKEIEDIVHKLMNIDLFQ